VCKVDRRSRMYTFTRLNFTCDYCNVNLLIKVAVMYLCCERKQNADLKIDLDKGPSLQL
jgi:hypothetical protein